MRKLPAFCFFLFSLLSTSTLFAQSLQPTVIAADGGFATTSSGSISWTLGETITETFSSSSHYLTQGFQQPSLVLMNSVGTAGLNNVFIYPNPATEIVNINLNYLPADNYTIELFDVAGKKISTLSSVNTGIIEFPLFDIANGAYLLTISSANFTQSYKVIKSR